MAKFLFYYRLVGDLLFELTGIRALLIIFPNTFEYFFIFYEAVRTRWNTARMGTWTVIIATVLIWVFIKLPQEWWIHIAQLDMTDFIKESLFGVSADATWGEAVSAAPWVLAAMIAGLALLVFVAWWMVRRWAPSVDHGMALKADPLPAEFRSAEFHRDMEATEKIFSRSLLEKFLLTGLVSVIFAQMLDVSDFGLAFVGVFIVLNAIVSQWLARRGRTWRSIAVEMAGMGVINTGIIFGLEIGERFLGFGEGGTPLGKTLFFVFLLTVLTVLFDRYQAVLKVRGVLRRAADATDDGHTPKTA
jgi:flagellar biosynthesis protein FliQ